MRTDGLLSTGLVFAQSKGCPFSSRGIAIPRFLDDEKNKEPSPQPSASM